MKWIKFLLSFIVTAVIFYFLNFPIGLIPPLGKFLNPFAGFWQNNGNSDKIPEVLELDGLKGEVIIQWDDRHVPHIFAQHDDDLYFAQGYLTARDRLWQMEFQTHAAAGRISEIIGERGLAYDRFKRRIGMTYAAENVLQEILKNPEARLAAEAYSDGVNAFIKNLSPKKLPIEYKILNYEPEEWRPLKSALLLKMMAWDLTAYDIKELMRTQIASILDENRMEQLYPNYPPFTDSIIPPGTPWNFKPQLAPEPELDFDASIPNKSRSQFVAEKSIGSNNWAVSGKLTKSGFPILCSDPHLGLNLPSIWYEIQLVSPTVNVYGVSIPGAPSVIIGFNDKIAWGLTNAETDVLDWYQIEFQNESKSSYLFDGEWHPTTKRIEAIQIRSAETVLDTVYYTHHGPIVYYRNEKPYDHKIPLDAAMRWTGHDPSNELLAFLKLNRAKNYDDYAEAISHYACPGQNFAFADVNGDIAIWHNGKFPIRWQRQGRQISDGRKSAYDWHGYIPQAHLPHIKNPARDFVSSANQFPTTPEYPYYLTGNYENFERGARINVVLSQLRSITPQDMIRLQNDLFNLHAQMALPVMLAAITKNDWQSNEAQALKLLQDWNYENRADFIAPTIYEYWWRELANLIWSQAINKFNDSLPTPRRDVILAMILHHPGFDEPIDNFQNIASQAYRNAMNKLTEKFGSLGSSWRWGVVRGTDIQHLAQIPAFSRMGLQTSGNQGIVNAIGKHHGPSWRMVVELSTPIQAWGIYPGGQSGNPGSKFYDLMVDDWVQGEIYELVYLTSPDETHKKLIGKTNMRGSK